MKIEDSSRLTATFKYLAVLNEAASKKEGRAIYDDVEVCEIRLPANKQTVGVYPAHDVKEFGDDPNIPGVRVPLTYAMKFNAQYLAFKNGDAQAVSGTPLEALTFLSPGKRLELKALNIYTAEVLAGLEGAQLKQLGMGGRDLKNQAADFIANAGEHVTERVLATTVAEQDAKIADLQHQIAELLAAGKQKAVRPAPETAAAPVTAADVLALADTAPFMTFKSAATKFLGEGAPTTKGELVAALLALGGPVQSPFADFDDADIINWLAEAAPELDVEGLSRDALIAKADEINESLADKSKAA